MRIRFILTVFAAFLSLICSAQDEKTHKNMLFKAGINWSKLTDDDYYDHYSTRQGFNVGFEAQIPTSNPCVYSIGLMYSQQGSHAEGFGVYKMDYINLPLLLNVYLWKGLAIKGGFQPGIFVYGKKKGNRLTEHWSYDENESITPEFRLEFSIPVGISYEFSRFQVDARYNFGLNDALREGARHRVIQLSLGYIFKK
jgi:hypothetical protein